MARLAISWNVLLLLLLVPAIGSTAPPPDAPVRDTLPADARGQPGTICLRPHRDEVGAVAVSPDGRLVATGCGGDHAVGLWDAARGTALHVLRFKCDFPNHWCRTTEVTCVAFSPDSRRVATGGNGRIYFWDTATGKEVGQLAGQRREDRYAANALAFAPDGRVLATTGWHEAGVRLWDPASGGLIRRIYPHGERERHHGAVACLAVSPDGRVLATGSISRLARMRGGPTGPPAQESVQLWDVATGTRLRGLRPAAAAPAFVAFSPDGHTLLTGGVSCAGGSINGVIIPRFMPQPVQAWSVAEGKEVRKLDQTGSLLALALDGRELAIARVEAGTVWNGGKDLFVHASGMVLLVDAHTGKPRLTLEGYGGAVALSPDGTHLATGRGSRLHLAGKVELRWADRIEDSRLHLWETATGRTVLRFPDEPPTVLAFAPDGRRLLAGTRTGAVYLAETGPPDIGALAAKVDRKALDKLWQDLAAEAPVAYHAAAALSAARRQAPAYLSEHLWPAPAKDAALGRLVADLSAERYVVRRSARMELARRGADAGPALQAARKRVKSARVRRWLDELLADPGIGRFPSPLRRARAVRVLEQIGTPEARDVLKRLAASAPEGELIRQAKAALRRLDRRPRSP